MIKALKSLGYRPHPKKQQMWIKPCGSNVFLCDVVELTFQNRFYAATGEFLCWKSTDLKTIDIKGYNNSWSQCISWLEDVHFHSFFPLKHPDLGFLTLGEEMEL